MTGYFAQAYDREGRSSTRRLGPYADRETALAAIVAAFPSAYTFTTFRGLGGFDIRSHGPFRTLKDRAEALGCHELDLVNN